MPNISAAALMEDGAPLLILDVEDMIQSIARLLSRGGLKKILARDTLEPEKQKRVLIVDDSLTVQFSRREPAGSRD